MRCDSELVDVTIHWAGGYESHHEIIRPVGTYARLRDFESLMKRVVELRRAGKAGPQKRDVVPSSILPPVPTGTAAAMQEP